MTTFANINTEKVNKKGLFVTIDQIDGDWQYVYSIWSIRLGSLSKVDPYYKKMVTLRLMGEMTDGVYTPYAESKQTQVQLCYLDRFDDRYMEVVGLAG